MEFGSSQHKFSLEKTPRTRQSNRPLLRKQLKKVPSMLETSSDDDDDIMMMENRGLRKHRLNDDDRFQQLLADGKEEALEEQRQDNLLKELGLFEEGMSKQQKKELILVVQASKESAEKEETMRKRSDDFPSSMVNINGKTKDAIECLPSSTSRSASPSQERKQKRGLMNVGDSDEDTRMTPSQDLFPSLRSNPEQFLSQEKMPDQEEDSFGSFPAGQQTSENSMFKLSENTAKPERWLMTRLNRKRPSQDRRTTAMETAMAVWSSQIASAVVTSLARNTKRNLSDEVPYFCPLAVNPSAYTKVILHNINDYRICLQKVQRRTSDPIAWGDPILLGKSRLLGQLRSRDVPSTSVEEPMDDQEQPLPDLEVCPVGHLEIRPVTEEKLIQIAETSKKDGGAEDVFAILSRDSGSVENENSSKKSSSPENEIDDTDDDGKHCVSNIASFCRPRLSLKLESESEVEFEILPLMLDGDTPEEVLTGGATSPIDRIIPEIKPKKLRKRNRNNDVAANSVCAEKRPKRQVKDKYSSMVKR